MIYYNLYKCRNYNFLQLIKSYNELISKQPSNMPISILQRYRMTENLLGDDSVDLLGNALFYDGEKIETRSLGLFEGVKGKYYLAQNAKIFPPPSKEEVAFVNYLLNNEDFDLFLNQDEKKLLQRNIISYFANLNMEVPHFSQYIVEKGAPKTADRLMDIKEKYEVICVAIKNDRTLRFTYYYNDTYKTVIAKPVSFVFSQLDRRMKAKMHIDGVLKTFYLSNMSKLVICDDPVQLAAGSEQIRELVISCKNEANIVERVAARFSDYQKEIHFDIKNNTLKYRIFYNDNVNEHNRILTRLLYLSSRITVQSDEVNELKAIAKKALEQYREAQSTKKVVHILENPHV